MTSRASWQRSVSLATRRWTTPRTTFGRQRRRRRPLRPRWIPVPVMGKSQIKSQVQITNNWQKWFKSNLKSKIKSQIIKSNPNHFSPNQIKSNHKSISPQCHFWKCSVYIITIDSRKNYNCFAYVHMGKIKVLLEKDNGVNTKQWKKHGPHEHER